MLKRRVGKLHTSGELLPVELAFLRDEELPGDRPFSDLISRATLTAS